MVQWLRLCTSTAGAVSSIPGQGIKILHAIWLEKAMAPHSSTLAWKIPWTEEPCRLQSMRLLSVRHDWATSLSLFTFMHWKRKWQPTPVFLPGESQGQRSLVGSRLRGCSESDTTEATYQQQQGQHATWHGGGVKKKKYIYIYIIIPNMKILYFWILIIYFYLCWFAVLC